MASQPTRQHATTNFNHLERGTFYRATTREGAAIGEYLGMETCYGERAILLRHPSGTASIGLGDITSILAA